MRDVKRIEPFLRELKYHWERMPDLRLGQLIENAAAGATFNVDDDDLMDMIRTYHEAVDYTSDQEDKEPVYDGS